MALSDTMTIADVHAEIAALADAVGASAEISLYMGLSKYNRDPEFRLSIYPSGHSRGQSIAVESADWPDLFGQARALWEEHKARHRRQTIRAMAMKIIEITADQGACTDAALRQHFQVGEVEDLGALAVEDANEISSRGPFSITTQGGSNRQPGDDEEA